jgi:hypothetical protein
MSTSTTLPQALQASLNQDRANITLAHREVPEGVVSTMVTHFLDGFFQSQSDTSSGPAQIYSDGPTNNPDGNAVGANPAWLYAVGSPVHWRRMASRYIRWQAKCHHEGSPLGHGRAARNHTRGRVLFTLPKPMPWKKTGKKPSSGRITSGC